MFLRYTKFLFIVPFTSLFLFSCFTTRTTTLKPVGYKTTTGNTLVIENGDLKAVFADNNAAPPDHKAGYNGIVELSHSQEKAKLFVPDYAGFNLEFIFGGDSLHQLFEPRLYPMTLIQKSKQEILLYQEATPLSGVESLTSFKLVEPHYIDITFNCVFHNKEFFRHGYAGLFWASYIQNPGDKKIYFEGVAGNATASSWIEAYSEKHGTRSTHKSVKDNNDFYFAKNFNVKLANSFSEFRYTQPFYYGRLGKMMLAHLFDAKEIIRFSQSPDGGGELNPAWDFQYIVPSPETMKKYSFKARLIYKPFISDADVIEEYEKWKRK